MCNTTKETKEFFMFSYFGILPKEIFNEKEKLKKEYKDYFDYVARKCAYRAYLDLNITLKVNKKISEEDRKSIVLAICDKLVGDIKILLFNKNDSEDYDKSHKQLCLKIKNHINTESALLDLSNNEFHDGQAQKWLNMTLKYMWLLGFLEDEIETQFLHVPVDNYIIKAVWEFDDIKLPLIEEKLRKDKSRGKYSTEKYRCWSNWEYDEYGEFQDSLKKHLKSKNRIDWEHYAWMKYAE